MNRTVSTLLLITALSSNALAIGLEEDAFQLAHEIKTHGPTLDPEQRTKISGYFKLVRDMLLKKNAANEKHFCVSRDNDGKAPLKDAELIRIDGSHFTSAETCQASLNSGKLVKDGILVCISRDSDGKDPWLFGLLDQAGGLKKMDNTISTSFSDCQKLLNP